MGLNKWLLVINLGLGVIVVILGLFHLVTREYPKLTQTPPPAYIRFCHSNTTGLARPCNEVPHEARV